MQNRIIGPNGANLRAGQFAGIRFRPDGGDEGGGEVKTPEAKTPETAPPDPEKESMKAELERLRKVEETAKQDKKDAELAKLDEVGRAKAEADQAKQEAVASRKEAAAARFKLPEDVAELLKGETKDEIEAHAKKLAALFPAAKEAASTGTPAGGTPAAKHADAVTAKEAELAEAMKAGPSRIMDVLKYKTELAKLKNQTK